MEEEKFMLCCMFADEIYQKLDDVVKYNNIQMTRKNKSLKPLRFGDINLLDGVIRVDFTGENVLCYGVDDCLKSVIFVGEIPLEVDLDLFRAVDAKILCVLVPYNQEVMTRKLNNGRLKIDLIEENEVFQREVQFPKIRK